MYSTYHASQLLKPIVLISDSWVLCILDLKRRVVYDLFSLTSVLLSRFILNLREAYVSKTRTDEDRTLHISDISNVHFAAPQPPTAERRSSYSGDGERRENEVWLMYILGDAPSRGKFLSLGFSITKADRAEFEWSFTMAWRSALLTQRRYVRVLGERRWWSQERPNNEIHVCLSFTTFDAWRRWHFIFTLLTRRVWVTYIATVAIICTALNDLLRSKHILPWFFFVGLRGWLSVMLPVSLHSGSGRTIRLIWHCRICSELYGAYRIHACYDFEWTLTTVWKRYKIEIASVFRTALIPIIKLR